MCPCRKPKYLILGPTSRRGSRPFLSPEVSQEMGEGAGGRVGRTTGTSRRDSLSPDSATDECTLLDLFAICFTFIHVELILVDEFNEIILIASIKISECLNYTGIFELNKPYRKQTSRTQALIVGCSNLY